MSGYKQINVKLVAGQRNEFAAVGKYLRILKSAGDLVIEFDGIVGGFIQQGIGIPVSNGFKRVAITSVTSQAIIVGVADDRIDDSRLSLDAPVNIIDESFNKSIDSLSFEGFWNKGATAGDYTAVALWNPLGSGVSAAVKQVVGSSIAGGTYQLVSITAMALGVGWGAVPYGGDSKNLINPKEAAKCVLNTYSNVGSVSSVSLYYRFSAIQANSSESMVVEYPWIIPESRGLVLVSQSTGQDCAASFEWEEF